MAYAMALHVHLVPLKIVLHVLISVALNFPCVFFITLSLLLQASPPSYARWFKGSKAAIQYPPCPGTSSELFRQYGMYSTPVIVLWSCVLQRHMHMSLNSVKSYLQPRFQVALSLSKCGQANWDVISGSPYRKTE